MTPTKCQATNVDGNPCAAAHWKDGWCRWHSPELVDQRRVWSVQGGKQSSAKARLRKQIPDGAMSMEEIHAMLCVVMRGVLSGRVDKGAGNAIANLARAINDIGGSAVLENRVIELEALLGERGTA